MAPRSTRPSSRPTSPQSSRFRLWISLVFGAVGSAVCVASMFIGDAVFGGVATTLAVLVLLLVLTGLAARDLLPAAEAAPRLSASTTWSIGYSSRKMLAHSMVMLAGGVALAFLMGVIDEPFDRDLPGWLNTAARAFLAMAGVLAIFSGVCVAIQSRKSDAVLEIGPAGIRDFRYGGIRIPWSAVRRITAYRNSKRETFFLDIPDWPGWREKVPPLSSREAGVEGFYGRDCSSDYRMSAHGLDTSSETMHAVLAAQAAAAGIPFEDTTT